MRLVNGSKDKNKEMKSKKEEIEMMEEFKKRLYDYAKNVMLLMLIF